MYTPPGARWGQRDWKASNCIRPTWLPSSMMMSMGGTDWINSSQNWGSSWLPIQIDVRWSSSSPARCKRVLRSVKFGKLKTTICFRFHWFRILIAHRLAMFFFFKFRHFCFNHMGLSCQRKGSSQPPWCGDVAQSKPSQKRKPSCTKCIWNTKCLESRIFQEKKRMGLS